MVYGLGLHLHFKVYGLGLKRSLRVSGLGFEGSVRVFTGFRVWSFGSALKGSLAVSLRV